MNEKTPIDLLSELLAQMTTRAMDAERELAEIKSNDNDWYHHFQRKDAEAKELSTKLETEIAEHQQTRRALSEALANTEKGAQDNGKSNQ